MDEFDLLHQKKQQMIDILTSHGIKMSVGGCGCCGSPFVAFEYKGELIIDLEDEFKFDMFDPPESHNPLDDSDDPRAMGLNNG